MTLWHRITLVVGIVVMGFGVGVLLGLVRQYCCPLPTRRDVPPFL